MTPTSQRSLHSLLLALIPPLRKLEQDLLVHANAQHQTSSQFRKVMDEILTEALQFANAPFTHEALATRPVGWAVQLTFALANERSGTLTAVQHREITSVATALLQFERCLMLAESGDALALADLTAEIEARLSVLPSLNAVHFRRPNYQRAPKLVA